MLAFSLNSNASGGFSCDGDIKGIHVQVSGSTGHVVGNPLVSDISIAIGEEVLTIPKNYVAGYWNSESKFLLNVIDEQAEYSQVYLEVSKERGTLTLDTKLLKGTTKVKCLFE